MPTAVEMKTEVAKFIPEIEPVRGLQKVLLKNFRLQAGQEKRLFPQLSVSRWDRLHFHIANGNMAVAGLEVRILFGTPMDDTHCGALLADSTIWFEENVTERQFKYTTPVSYNHTGFVMSVPVVAPQLYDVILKNVGTKDLESVYVTVMGQEV